MEISMNRLYQFMNWPEIEGLVYSECSHPMELLGAHMCRDGMLVQVFRPDAVEAEIHIAGRKKAYACEKVDESGYFAVCIPIKKQTAYTVCIEDIKGQKKEYMDLFFEFDNLETDDSLFANTIDRLQPIMLNYYRGGGSWEEHGIKIEQVYKRIEPMKKISTKLYEYTKGIIENYFLGKEK